MGTISAVLTILAAVLPTVLLHWLESRKARNAKQDALVHRSVDELGAGYDRLHKREPPVQ